jgi:hypothetical protein
LGKQKFEKAVLHFIAAPKVKGAAPGSSAILDKYKATAGALKHEVMKILGHHAASLLGKKAVLLGLSPELAAKSNHTRAEALAKELTPLGLTAKRLEHERLVAAKAAGGSTVPMQ